MTSPLLELVLEQGARVPLVGEVTLGRDPSCTVMLGDPAVSRRHARISGSSVQDLGSLSGTFLDGVRITGTATLHDGARLRLGDTELLVSEPRDELRSLQTIVVPAGIGSSGSRVRVRPGYALKRLEAAEGDRRWVLNDLEAGAYLRFSDDDARLFEQLDGTHTLTELIDGAEQRLGDAGPERLAGLLADLGDRGLIEGVAAPAGGEAAQPWYGRMLRPREKLVPGAGAVVDCVYRAGGWRLLTRPALIAIRRRRGSNHAGEVSTNAYGKTSISLNPARSTGRPKEAITSPCASSCMATAPKRPARNTSPPSPSFDATTNGVP